jgi:hypothetical protein
VKLQSKLCILPQQAAAERSLFGHLARGQSKEPEQARRAFERAEITFSDTYEKLLQQPAGTVTFNPRQPGRHKPEEQSELPSRTG